MAWFAPVVMALGTVAQGVQQRKAGEYNARMSEIENKASQDQASREEEALRRDNRQFFGRQRAALAESGLGSGGTTGMMLDQSALLAELDAQNLRYQGAVRGAGLISQARSSRYGGRAASANAGLLAGAQLLSMKRSA